MFQVLDAVSATLDFKSTDNAGVHTPHHNIEFASVAPTVGSGAADTGTLRVILATDQATLPVSGAFTITAIVPGVAATSLGKAEDSPHTTGDTGVFILAVRNDALATFGANLDYIPISTDSRGVVNVILPDVTIGGTLLVADSAVATSLAIMDDWDETDRAKVNIIAGQVGVQGGSGTTNALTLRVVLATDVALPAGTNNIGDVDVLSIVPGVAATNLGKAEDAAHASGDTGVMMLIVRQDTMAAFGADNDYAPPSANASGQLRVEAGGVPFDVSVEKTRPADTNAYAADDCINESASAGTVWTFAVARTSGGGGTIQHAIVESDDITDLSAVELDLYNVSPAVVVNDNAQATKLYTDAAKFICTLYFPIPVKETSSSTMSTAELQSINQPFKASGSVNIIGVLRNVTARTPAASEKFRITLKGYQD